MRFLLQLMHGLHKTIGITAPQPEHEKKVLFVWIGLLAMIFGGTALLGFVLLNVIASTR